MTAAAVHDSGEVRQMLEALYRAANDRDVEGVVENLAPGVAWTDIVTGKPVHGRDAVRDAWQAQWQKVQLSVEPMRINVDADGTAHVVVDQLVKSLAGEILQNKQVEQVFEFEGPFISRMTIVDLAQGEIDKNEGDWDGDGVDDSQDTGGADGPGGDGSAG